jgi:hypothetical protein
MVHFPKANIFPNFSGLKKRFTVSKPKESESNEAGQGDEDRTAHQSGEESEESSSKVRKPTPPKLKVTMTSFICII